MQITAPTVTIRNTDTAEWLITVENLVTTTQQENIAFTVAVPRSDLPMPQMLVQATRRAIELLQVYVDVSDPPPAP